MDDYTSRPSMESTSINTSVTTLPVQLSGLPLLNPVNTEEGHGHLGHSSPKYSSEGGFSMSYSIFLVRCSSSSSGLKAGVLDAGPELGYPLYKKKKNHNSL